MSCSCNHSHHHHHHDHCHDEEHEEIEREEKEEEEEGEGKKSIILLIIGIVALIIGFTLTKLDPVYGEIEWSLFSDSAFFGSYAFIAFIFYTVGYLILFSNLLMETIESWKDGTIFNESLLMLVATVGAYAIGEYPEALFVVIFNIIGEMLEDYATDKSKQSIKKLVNGMPLYAHVVHEDGHIEEEDPSHVEIGTLIEVRPGEKIALDGIIEKGHASLDLSSINGESLPTDYGEGSQVYSGAIVLDSSVVIRTTKLFKDSTLSKIMDLVESEQSKKAKSEKFITRFAKVYTPIVMTIALLVFIIGYGVSGFVWEGANGGQEWLYKALSILLVSCPCALVISVPVAFFAGIGQASKFGVLIKGSLPLENLAKSTTFTFDKTGTLTKGNFALKNTPDEESLKIAASLESKSTHPLGKAICDAYKGELYPVEDFKNYPGLGISGIINGETYYIGTKKLLLDNKVLDFEEENTLYKALYLGKENSPLLASFIVADEIKETSIQAIDALKKEGSLHNIMLSGDDSNIAKEVGKEVGVDEAIGNLLPEEKLSKVKEYSAKEKVCYVGDGINDSPSLLAASAGVAMGALGSDAAIESSDIVVMDDDLRKVAEAKRLSKKTMIKVYGSIILSLGIKVLIMILVSIGVFGPYAMIIASLGDTGVMVIAILYVMTLMFYKPRYLGSNTKPSPKPIKEEA